MTNIALQDPWGIDITVLVPQPYAAYRPLLADALVFFLRRLPAPRLVAILAEQKNLPPHASPSQRLTALICHCPTLHKLGQVVARNRKLAPELRRRLQALESMEATTSLATMRPVIRRELGDLQAAGLRLAPTALAEASVAVVIPFSLPCAQSSGSTGGVLKVLKPGIEERLQEELAIWSQLSVFIDERCEYHRIPPLHYAETLETIRALLANEIRLEREQRHLAEAADFYADVDSVQIPSLFPFCTPRITAMERIHGEQVTETQDLSGHQRRRLANSIIEALIARPVWTPREWALFHADPHAGNLVLTQDERLAILDWSLAGHLGKTARIHTMQLMLGALTLDTQRIARAIASLAQAAPDESALRRVVDKALGRIYAGGLPSFPWLLELLDDAMLSAHVRFGEELLLFRRSVLTLEGVIGDISSKSSLERVLPASAARQFLREWLSRALAFPTSRHFATHLSNLDLISLYWGAPMAATRFWTHYWEQRLSALLASPKDLPHDSPGAPR